MNGEEYLREKLRQALATRNLAPRGEVEVVLEKPKLAAHGDLASNVAMALASKLRRNPREIAAEIVEALELDDEVVSGVEVAGAGFINFRFGPAYFQQGVREILQRGDAYGRAEWGKGTRVQIEFVSANPTGPLNVVSARAATVGDVLANLFAAVGFDISREYYVNDA
ncbi:MAG: arginine--tRNA ligase, partial [Calditrichaeota bacterium]